MRNISINCNWRPWLLGNYTQSWVLSDPKVLQSIWNYQETLKIKFTQSILNFYNSVCHSAIFKYTVQNQRVGDVAAKGGKQEQVIKLEKKWSDPVLLKIWSSDQLQHLLETCKKCRLSGPRRRAESETLGWSRGLAIWVSSALGDLTASTQVWEPLIRSTHSAEKKETKPVTSLNSYTKLVTNVTANSFQYT